MDDYSPRLMATWLAGAAAQTRAAAVARGPAGRRRRRAPPRGPPTVWCRTWAPPPAPAARAVTGAPAPQTCSQSISSVLALFHRERLHDTQESGQMQQVTDRSRLTSQQEPRCRRPEAPARPPDCWQPGPERQAVQGHPHPRCITVCAMRHSGQFVCQLQGVQQCQALSASRATCCRSCLSRWKTSCSETPADLSCSGPASGGSPSVRSATLSTCGDNCRSIWLLQEHATACADRQPASHMRT